MVSLATLLRGVSLSKSITLVFLKNSFRIFSDLFDGDIPAGRFVVFGQIIPTQLPLRQARTKPMGLPRRPASAGRSLGLVKGVYDFAEVITSEAFYDFEG